MPFNKLGIIQWIYQDLPNISEIKPRRTDTTLDLSQQAENIGLMDTRFVAPWLQFQSINQSYIYNACFALYSPSLFLMFSWRKMKPEQMEINTM